MRKFNYADREIVFSDDFEFFHPYKLLLERQILEYVFEWDDRKKNTTSLDDYLNSFSSFFRYAKSSLASLAVEILVNNNIYEYDESRFLNRYGQELDARNFDTYKQLVNRKANIVKAYNENEQYKAIQRASRSRWSGGGFGISGAIKGAVKAGAMNAVTGAVRGIGDSIRDNSDQREYKERLSSIINQYDEEHLLDDMYFALIEGIEFNLFTILEKRTGFDAAIVLGKCMISAQSMFNNLTREGNVEKRVSLYEQILQRNPYEWEYISYVLSNSKDVALTNAIGLDNMCRIAEYLEPTKYKRMIVDDIYDKMQSILNENISIQLMIEKMLKIGIEYNCFDKEYHLNDDLWELGQDIIFEVIFLEDILYRDKHSFTEESEKSYEKVSQYIDFMKNLLEKYRVYIDGRINSKYHENDSVRKLQNFLRDIEEKKKRAYTELCTSKDGHVYDSPDEAVVHNKEKMVYDKILASTSPYMVYEKSILEELIKKLDENNFKSKYIVEEINVFRRKLIRLRGRENTKHYEQGKKLKEAFETIGDCAGIYLYGRPGFVESSMKIAKVAPTLSKDLNTYFPILIVGEWQQEDCFKGIIITDEYIVVSGYFWVSDLRRSWDTLNKIVVNKNKIELHFSDTKLKFKISDNVSYVQALEIFAQYLKIIFVINGIQKDYATVVNNNDGMQKVEQQKEGSLIKNESNSSFEKNKLNENNQSQVGEETREQSNQFNNQDIVVSEAKNSRLEQEGGNTNNSNSICQEVVQTKQNMKKRQFFVYLLLTVLTCGIYSLYFWYRYTEDVNKICDGDGKKSPNYIVVILLSCVTLGVYSLYWRYTQTNRLYKAGLKYNVPIKEKGVSIVLLYLSYFITYFIGIFVAQYIMIHIINRFTNVEL